MKNKLLKVIVLALTLVLSICSFIACAKPNNGGSSGSSSGGGDNPAVTEPIQITTTIYEIAKHGNLILYMYGSDLYDKGFEHGDILEIAIAGKTWEVPLCSSYSDVDNGQVVLRAIAPTDGVVLAINMGDFATTAGIAVKTTIDEEPGYRWDYVIDTPVEITITMKEEGGYREELLIRQLVRTNERTDYEHLTDEAFANFRVINTTGMGENVLYRSSSPINPAYGRSTYADKAAQDAGVKTVVNLADASNTYDAVEDAYYNTCQVVYVNLSMDFLAESTLSGIAQGMRFIINNNGPYLIHCNEGKDRAGFISALLECLMGASLNEVIDDYMLTYYNYYGVEQGSENYNIVVKNNVIKSLNTTFKVLDVYKADLVQEAEEFLMEDVGLTAEEVAKLKGRLCISIMEVYSAGENCSALLGEHENVFIQTTVNGKVLREEFLTNQYSYGHYNSQELEFGHEYSSFRTNNAEYYYYHDEEAYYYNVTINPNGVDHYNDLLYWVGQTSVVLPGLLFSEVSITQQDGSIIVVCNLSLDFVWFEENVVSCLETYTLDAATREMTSINIIYTYEDGTTKEKAITVIRDVEAPEGVKPFFEYVENAENTRTVTIVSNPLTENEKVDTVKIPKGVQISLSLDYGDMSSVEFFVDAACTQVLEDLDLYTDGTFYVKWSE